MVFNVLSHCCNMKNDLTPSGLSLNSVVVLTAYVAVAAAASPLQAYNGSIGCLQGSDITPIHALNCPADPHSVLLVRNVFHGLTPDSSGCSLTAAKERCCPDPVDPARDCIFASEEEADRTRERCDGRVGCDTTSIRRASVGDACPNRTLEEGDGSGGGSETLSYGSYSFFVFTEYSCVELDLMSDVCDSDDTMTGEELYLDSNFFHDNTNHKDRTCSCVILTECQRNLTFEVLAVDLNSNADGSRCRETVELTESSDSGTTVLASLNCSSRLSSSPSQGSGPFQSNVSVVGLDLHVSGTHNGTLLIRVTATEHAPVQVICGQRGSQQLLNRSQCLEAPEGPGPISPTTNTTKVACVGGITRILPASGLISCEDSPGVISVERVFHGVTPQAMGCNSLAPRSKCCPGFDSARDCLFSTDEGLEELRSRCDGQEVCSPTIGQVDVPSGACPTRQIGNVTYTYRSRSTFAFAEFRCVNVGVMSDICDEGGSTVRNTELYLETNVYHRHARRNGMGATCPCTLTAPCGHQLLFRAMILKLATVALASNGTEVCLERVTLQDGVYGSVRLELTCASSSSSSSSGEMNEAPIFQSQSNVVNFTLHYQNNSLGKIMFKVVATDNATVEIRCGSTATLPVSEWHQCNDTTTTTTTTDTTTADITTATATATATATTEVTTAPNSTTPAGGDGDGGGSDRETAITIAAVVVASLIAIVFIIIIVLICKNRKKQQSEALDPSQPEDDGNEDGYTHHHHHHQPDDDHHPYDEIGAVGPVFYKHAPDDDGLEKNAAVSFGHLPGHNAMEGMDSGHLEEGAVGGMELSGVELVDNSINAGYEKMLVPDSKPASKY